MRTLGTALGSDRSARSPVRWRRAAVTSVAVLALAAAASACGDDEQDAPPVGSEVVPGEEGPVG